MIAKLKRIFRAVYYMCCVVVFCSAITGAAYFSGSLKHIEIKEIEKVVPVEVPQQSIEDLLEEIPPKYDISPIVAKAVAKQESQGKNDSIRYEPGQVWRAQKITKDPEQQRMYASSHCAMQIMGWWAPEFNLSWADLYKPENCVEVSMAILKDCMDKHKGKSKMGQLRGALTCYNGSEKYADEVLSRIGSALMQQYL